MSSVAIAPQAGKRPFRLKRGVSTFGDLNNKPIDVTASLTIVPQTHAGKTLTLNAAAGVTVTLPAASGTGELYRFIVVTTITSNTSVVKVANASDVMTGVAFQAADGGSTVVAWETAADSDTITMDGSTKGGIKGDLIELQDVAANLWYVKMLASGTGTEATPFSAAV